MIALIDTIPRMELENENEHGPIVALHFSNRKSYPELTKLWGTKNYGGCN